jgi:translation initiation factor IF-3
VPYVKLIDEQEGLLGVVPIQEALQKAREKELDLIEVSPKENPPVAKILDYGKFKYQLEKKKQKSKSKKTETKGIRLNLNMASHDLETREKQAKKFLEDGHKIQCELILQGREAIHVTRAYGQLADFLKQFGGTTEVIQPTTRKGKRITVVLQPKHKPSS